MSGNKPPISLAIVLVLVFLLVICVLLVVLFYLYANRLTAALTSMTGRQLATIVFEIWDDDGQPRVLVDTHLDDPDYDLAKVVALAIPLLVEDQMRVMSTERQDILEEGIQSVVNRFRSGQAKPSEFTGQEETARYIAAFRISVFEGRLPFLINDPPATGRFTPPWASDVEEACAVAIPIFVEHELNSLPTDAQDFVVQALELELERWKLHRPEKGKYEYDWDFLLTWGIKK